MFFQVIDNEAGISDLSTVVLDIGKLALMCVLGLVQAKTLRFKFDVRHAQVSFNF